MWQGLPRPCLFCIVKRSDSWGTIGLWCMLQVSYIVTARRGRASEGPATWAERYCLVKALGSATTAANDDQLSPLRLSFDAA